MAIVLFHGSFNSRQQITEFWLPELQKSDSKIIFPEYPTDSKDEITEDAEMYIPKRQTLVNWYKVFESELEKINSEESNTFVGHSSGPLFILHVLQKYNIKIDKAVFVCPFVNFLTRPSVIVKKVNDYLYKTELDFTVIKGLIRESFSLYSTNDPYVENENSIEFAQKLDSTLVPVENGGHLNTHETAKTVTSYILDTLRITYT